eukprot:TRINITY_DN16032_c0_g1_i1.p1 TRINITY_DN16032_c0_g1~~TRINITY_DN16032_c0_g1_i1.p1  ORF type:complete len:148 (+),score=19.59 TRINITY_DN16032_c0_g1_i1:16-459(+)
MAASSDLLLLFTRDMATSGEVLKYTMRSTPMSNSGRSVSMLYQPSSMAISPLVMTGLSCSMKQALALWMLLSITFTGLNLTPSVCLSAKCTSIMVRVTEDYERSLPPTGLTPWTTNSKVSFDHCKFSTRYVRGVSVGGLAMSGYFMK